MKSLEDRLRPCADTPSAHLRDGLVWMLLTALFIALLPTWWIDGALVSSLRGGELSDLGDVIERFSGQLLSFWLLPAMGFMLALRCGAVDLSVWTTAALGGVVSAVMLGEGSGPAEAIFAGVLAGAICGLVNGLLVAGLRVPCPVVSLATSLGLMVWLGREYSGGEIVLADGSLDGLLSGFQSAANWFGLPDVTLQGIAAVAVFIVYSGTMVLLVFFNGRPDRESNREPDGESNGESDGESGQPDGERGVSERWRLFAALIACGALSAAGGVFCLIEHQTASVPGRPVGDLMIPAAALLAGGLYLAGPGRTLLACVLLPVALAVATGWRQEVLNLRLDFLAGYRLQVVCLAGMVAIARYAMTCAAVAARWHGAALTLAWSSSVGIAVVAASVWTESPAIRSIVHLAGGGLWLVGAAGAMAVRLAWPRCDEA